jgi:hypothetical protein
MSEDRPVGQRTRRSGLALLVLLYVAGSWYPFRLDLPFRADDVVVDGAVHSFTGQSLATSDRPPIWLPRAIDDASLRVELEARATAPDQTGPARLLSISEGIDAQNLVIGQDGQDLVVRVRRLAANDVGEPAFRVPGALEPGRWRTIEVEVADDVTVWVDGVIRNYARDADAFGWWDDAHQLSLGNEQSWDRGWQGEIRRAEVVVDSDRTDLLDGELTSSWDGRWIPPGRLLEDTQRSFAARVAVWALHLVSSAVAVAAVALLWPAASPMVIALRWAGIAALLNLGKIVIDTRHPSVTTWALQTVGGFLGAWLILRRGMASAHERNAT